MTFLLKKRKYKIRKGKYKDIRILANWPGFVHGEVECNVVSDSDEFIRITSKKTKLKYTEFEDGTIMAIGHLKIHGINEGGPTTLKTSLQGKEIETKISVIPPKQLGQNIEIKVVDEPLGDQRAVWSGNLLKINGRHNTIKRYLDPEFEPQDSLHFRVLLAELIADNVAKIVIERNSNSNTREYDDMDPTSFYNKHRRYVNEFIEIAHKIQIPESEIIQINANS